MKHGLCNRMREGRGHAQAVDLVRRFRTAVTCLLHDEGGWWSPSCVRSAAALPDTNPLLESVLVRAALAELARDGHVEVGSAGPGSEPLFRWVR